MSKEELKQEAPEEIAERIEGLEWYSYLAKIGFAIILIAFLSAVIGVLPSNLNSVSTAVNAVLLPSISLGLDSYSLESLCTSIFSISISSAKSRCEWKQERIVKTANDD